jgi:L-ascorbate metabolism protein UlaG (beta-lactamase superfamily)
LRITYIGHATLLIELAGKRFLTDPNFEPSLGKLLPRVSKPGIAIDRLPKIDAIFVTHAHADHLSFKSLEGLDGRVPIFAPPPIAKWLKRRGHSEATPIGPGESVHTGTVEVHAASATHKGHRYGVDRWHGSANMYLFDTKAISCFFAGDTGLTPDSTGMVERQLLPNGRRLDMALLPIGHAPWWKLQGFRKGHLTSGDALTLFERLDARYLIPYHWGTFDHVTSKAHDAIDQLREQLPGHAREEDVRILEPGMTFELPAAEG